MFIDVCRSILAIAALFFVFVAVFATLVSVMSIITFPSAWLP